MITLSNLSKYRSELMGFAMLIVVWHHIQTQINYTLYSALHMNAGFGVDIFLLLSGLGLYFSSKNGLNIKEYYVKRFIRIIPIYALVIVITSLIMQSYDISLMLRKISTIGWWLNNGAYEWFIPNLVLLYLIYPLFYLYMKVVKNRWIVLLSIVLFYMILCNIPYGAEFRGGFQALLRFPTFFLGVFIGKEIVDKKETLGLNWLFIVSSIVGIGLSIWAYITFHEEGLYSDVKRLLNQNGWLFIPYFVMVSGFCLLLSCLFSVIEKRSCVLKFLSYIGGMSLEIYLIHAQFICLAGWFTDIYGVSKPLFGVIFILLSFVAAHYLHVLNVKIMESLSSQCRKIGLLK